MIQYAKKISSDEIQCIQRILNNYTAEMRLDQNYYHDIYCYNPNYPDGGRCGSFHVMTAPYMVTIYGHWMNAYTLYIPEHNKDALDFFNVKSAPYGYWAGKIINAPRHERITTVIDESLFFQEMKAELKVCNYPQSICDCIVEQAENNLKFDSTEADPMVQLRNCDFILSNDKYDEKIYKGCDIFGFDISFGECYTDEWIRTCEALKWVSNIIKS